MSKHKHYKHIDQRSFDLFVRIPATLEDYLIALAVDPLAAEDAYELKHKIPHSIEDFAAAEPHVLIEMKETIATWVKLRGPKVDLDEIIESLARYDPWLAMWCLLGIAAEASSRCKYQTTEMVLQLADRWMMRGRPAGELEERLMLFRRELSQFVNSEDFALRRCALCVLGATYALVESDRQSIVDMNGSSIVIAAKMMNPQRRGEEDEDHRERALDAMRNRWVDVIAKRVMQYPV